MCPHLSANYVLGCPSNMAQVSVWAGNLHILLFQLIFPGCSRPSLYTFVFVSLKIFYSFNLPIWLVT